jgi:N-acetylglucosaminyldiphosphoundecaprenol N-acetyl-beta-D-mannosaminyltransferase
MGSDLIVTNLCGYNVTSIDLAQLTDLVANRCKKGEGGWIFPMNLDLLSRGVRDSDLKKLMQSADLTFSDGMPLVWAIRKINPAARNHVRTTGSDLTRELLMRVPALEVGAIGGMDPVGALKNLGKDPAEYEIFDGRVTVDDPTVEALRNQFAGRKLVFVALGVPKQEQLIFRLRPLMPETVFIGVGASFEFLAGIVPRAPVWMQKSGFEWLYRLLKEPKRLWRRYLVECPVGGWALLKDIRRSRSRQSLSN